MILMNPLYNGWIRRHRGKDETRRPAPWRANPPVSDELWARVEEVRRAKTRGGGPKDWDRVDLLGGLLECVCGRRLRNDGTFGDGRHRKLHANPCEAWGRKARLGDETWEAPVLAQVAGIAARRRHDGVGRRGPRVEPPAGRIDRAGSTGRSASSPSSTPPARLGDDTYLARLKALREQRDAIVERTARAYPASGRSSGCAPSASHWQEADVPKEKADLMHAIYERITVAGPRDRRCPAHPGGLRARIGAGAARKG